VRRSEDTIYSTSNAPANWRGVRGKEKGRWAFNDISGRSTIESKRVSAAIYGVNASPLMLRAYSSWNKIVGRRLMINHLRLLS